MDKWKKYHHQEKDQQAKDGAKICPDTKQHKADTTKVQNAIATLQGTLTAKIDKVKIDISLLRQDLSELKDRVTEAETRIGTAEDIQHPLCHTMEDDTKNRQRRCNLWFIGLQERTEGNDPADYLETLLIKTYGREAFSVMFVVERAHSIPAKPPPGGAHPQTFIAKFLNFKDRDKILRLTRKQGNIPMGNGQVAVFPDFSNKVQ